jgi:hypothetical protein
LTPAGLLAPAVGFAQTNAAAGFSSISTSTVMLSKLIPEKLQY